MKAYGKNLRRECISLELINHSNDLPLKMAGIEDPQSANAEAKRLECPEDEIYSFVTFGSKREILTNTKIKVCGIASKDKIDQFVFSMKSRETAVKTFIVVT